jgi:aspartyl-tRNA(Asn)/glutamyl-tRNA(Gln) amidotransferase subunit A
VANAEASSNLARHDGVRYGRRAPQAKTAESVYRRTRGEGFGREVKRRIVLGTYGLSAGYYDAYYGRGQRARRQLIEEFAYAFDAGVDVLLTPTAPTVAFALGERLADPLSMYLSDVFTVPANLAGVPAVSIRGGMVDALPVGVQLMGRPFAEGKILRAARALEADLDSRGPVRPAPTDE